MVVLKRRVGVLVAFPALPCRRTTSRGGRGAARSCLLAVSVLLAVSACDVAPTQSADSGQAAADSGQARRLTAVDVRPSEATAAAPGGTAQFSATGTFDQPPTTQTDLAAQWGSSDSSLVTVEVDTGLATCVAKGGPVTVTASVVVDAGTVEGIGTLSCTGPHVLISLKVEPGIGIALSDGGVMHFTATGTFDEAPFTQANLPAEWTSSDPSVATVDAGVATCLALGGPIGVTASAPGRGGAVTASGELACVSSIVRFGGRCALFSGNVMSGYCLGARSGICHSAYDPTHCPAGQPAIIPGSLLCGSSGALNVDSARTCIP
jgi:hypothetical protein